MGPPPSKTRRAADCFDLEYVGGLTDYQRSCFHLIEPPIADF